jgi:two-component system capsular synthesis response regulator RcsB
MRTRIILADDHSIFSSGARLLLERDQEFEVTRIVTSPSELVSALEEDACDLLVTDFSMPGDGLADGLELLRSLRGGYPDLPIVVLTMLSNPGILRSVLDSGVNALVSKADAVTHLVLAVRTVMLGRRYLSKAVLNLLQEAGDDGRPSLDRLSPREREVIALFASGKAMSDVADALGRSIKTVSTQKMSAMEKLGLRSDLELYAYTREHKLT